MTAITDYQFTEHALTLDWQDGKHSKLAAIWLRDHCQMPESRDPISDQRLFDISDIPATTGIRSVYSEGAHLVIEFSPDSHRSVFSLQWLRNHCYCLNPATDDRSAQHKQLWHHDSFPRGLPRFQYAQFRDSESSKTVAMQAVKDLGFAVLEQVPCVEGEVLKVIAEFGYVRETNYGKLFDVRVESAAENLAYTYLGLGCHLDNPYRNPVPGIQLLHCLKCSTTGGESILQDGFMAAKILRTENPDHFDTLCQQWVDYRFRDSNTDLRARVPLIEVNDLSEVIQLHYNNRSIDTLKLAADRVSDFYAAYRHFAEIIQRKNLQIDFKLTAGELLILDNTRILHARKAYSKGGTRHLQGAYSDLDGLYSKLRTLQNSNTQSERR